MNDNVVLLKFKPDGGQTETIDFLICKHCHNKTFTCVYDAASEFPMMKCAACGTNLGRIGWADTAGARHE